MRQLTIMFAGILVAMLVRLAAGAEEYTVFKSIDSGRSWRRSDAGMPKGARINAFGNLDGVLLAGTDAGIFYSKDAARNWLPATGAASGRTISFAVLGKAMLAGTDGQGLLVSGDVKAGWTLERTFPSKKPRCMLAHEGKVYVGTDADGVYSRSGSGQFWNHLSAGLPSGAQVFALAVVRGRLFAGLCTSGLYAWDEQRQSWLKIGTVKPLALAGVRDTLIAGHNPGGLHWSEDSGATWGNGLAAGLAASPLLGFDSTDSGELSSEAPVWELGSDGESLVLAGAATGVYYSEDKGRTWVRARKDLPQESPGIAFLVSRDFLLAAILIKQAKRQPGQG